MKYEDLTINDLGTRRQRPMYMSAFINLERTWEQKNIRGTHMNIQQTFLTAIDKWITSHERVKYIGLDTFDRRDAILGTTHQLDELHMLNGKKITVYKGEYKYHRRLTDYQLIRLQTTLRLKKEMYLLYHILLAYYRNHKDFDKLLDHCDEL